MEEKSVKLNDSGLEVVIKKDVDKNGMNDLIQSIISGEVDLDTFRANPNDFTSKFGITFLGGNGLTELTDKDILAALDAKNGIETMSITGAITLGALIGIANKGCDE